MLVFVSSAALVPAFGLRKDSAHALAPEWLTAVGFTMLRLTSKASLCSQEVPVLLPLADLSVCVLALAIRRSTHVVAVN